MDDEGGDSADWVTLPYDVLIHLKGSLDDGVDAMVQLLSEEVTDSAKLHVKVEEVRLSEERRTGGVRIALTNLLLVASLIADNAALHKTYWGVVRRERNRDRLRKGNCCKGVP